MRGAFFSGEGYVEAGAAQGWGIVGRAGRRSPGLPCFSGPSLEEKGEKKEPTVCIHKC